MATVPEQSLHLIGVASQHVLVSQAVSAALASRGFDVVSVRWPGGVPAPRRPRAPTRYDAGLLLGELERAAPLQASMLLVNHVKTRWLVLTDTPAGPLWGAMYAAGARLVLPATISLDEMAWQLRAVIEGETRVEDERLALLDAWSRLRSHHEALLARMTSLTPREREVLALLNAGDNVADIGVLLEVSLSTVRSQVKSILRKLEVSSQLAAVAEYRTLLELDESVGAAEKVHLSTR